jgi:hypothetical protein
MPNGCSNVENALSDIPSFASNAQIQRCRQSVYRSKYYYTTIIQLKPEYVRNFLSIFKNNPSFESFSTNANIYCGSTIKVFQGASTLTTAVTTRLAREGCVSLDSQPLVMPPPSNILNPNTPPEPQNPEYPDIPPSPFNPPSPMAQEICPDFCEAVMKYCD